MPVAQAALETLGYAASVNERRPLAYQARYPGEIALKRPADGVMGVELDWSAFPGVWLARTAAVDHVAIWQRTRPVTVAPLRRWLLSILVNPESMLALRNLTRTSLRYALLLLLVDRPADAARLAWRALWPEAGWLAARYGCAGVWVRLRHLAGAVRGRV